MTGYGNLLEPVEILPARRTWFIIGQWVLLKSTIGYIFKISNH
jgi:hypothetical protein